MDKKEVIRRFVEALFSSLLFFPLLIFLLRPAFIPIQKVAGFFFDQQSNLELYLYIVFVITANFLFLAYFIPIFWREKDGRNIWLLCSAISSLAAPIIYLVSWLVIVYFLYFRG